MASTPDGGGYWEVSSLGGVFSFGDAQFYGSLGNNPPPSLIVGMAATPDGKGYWLVDAKGDVYSFGDANYYGGSSCIVSGTTCSGSFSVSNIVGMAATPDGNGYWLVSATGGVYSFGGANFDGSSGCSNPPSCSGSFTVSDIVGMTANPNGNGYWLVGADGGVFALGAPFYGSMGGKHSMLQ